MFDLRDKSKSKRTFKESNFCWKEKKPLFFLPLKHVTQRVKKSVKSEISINSLLTAKKSLRFKVIRVEINYF